MERKRNVLMIAAAFPPTGGSGVQRTAKFAKYLPKFGWNPTLWTIDGLEGMPRDETLLNDLPPEVTILANRWTRPMHGVRSAVARLAEREGLASTLGQAARWRLGSRLAEKESRLEPDHYISWAEASVDPLLRLIESGEFDAIYSTFSPASNHWLGLALKRKTGLPWIADFRDLWTDDYRYTETSVGRRRGHRNLEQEILEAADFVVGVSKTQTSILSNHVPAQRWKFVTITNGFDPDDFVVKNPASSTSSARHRFVLSHVGRFDQWRTGDTWFGGVAEFVQRLGPSRNRFELRIVGHADQRTRSKMLATGARCSFVDYLPHGEAVREMTTADALLLCVPSGPNAESVIPAKLFEYLAARRPVLVVGPADGEPARIVQSCGAGLVAPLDERKIANALCDLYDAWSAGRDLSGCSADQLQPFDRVVLTRRLASILDGSEEGTPDLDRAKPSALTGTVAATI